MNDRNLNDTCRMCGAPAEPLPGPPPYEGAERVPLCLRHGTRFVQPFFAPPRVEAMQ